ncbi:hypothetical protein [Streptomyces sp. NBC_00470]|uniref:hypothetical protein n=1 Tax=Streptomyces sp. NBC_00470 TaxID=2975753 RepID=UPI0030DE1A00
MTLVAAIALSGCDNVAGEGRNRGVETFGSVQSLSHEDGSLTKDGWREVRIRCLETARNWNDGAQDQEKFYNACVSSAGQEEEQQVALFRDADRRT